MVGVTTFATEEEAVRIANSTQYGLAAVIWSEDVRRVHRYAFCLSFMALDLLKNDCCAMIACMECYWVSVADCNPVLGLVYHLWDIRLLVALPYPLVFSCPTFDRSVAPQIQSGTVWVNCWMVRDLRVPFGGHKKSGLGRASGEDSIDFFTERTNICLKWG